MCFLALEHYCVFISFQRDHNLFIQGNENMHASETENVAARRIEEFFTRFCYRPFRGSGE